MSETQFITDVVVVSSKEKCPGGYFMVSTTLHGNDANLYEGSWGKRGDRYICYAKVPGSQTVITDLNIIKDKDSIPTGFTGIKHCYNDGGEKALRKHILCVKTDSIQKAQNGVMDILAVQQSKGESTPGRCYTITNDVNGINICYQTMPNAYVRQPLPYGHQANMPYRPPNVQPSYPAYSMPYPSQHVGYNSMPVPVARQGTAPPGNISRQQSAGKLASGIQGVQFQVNPKFEMLWKHPNISEQSTKICSLEDIEKKYGYTFEKEKDLLSTR